MSWEPSKEPKKHFSFDTSIIIGIGQMIFIAAIVVSCCQTINSNVKNQADATTTAQAIYIESINLAITATSEMHESQSAFATEFAKNPTEPYINYANVPDYTPGPEEFGPVANDDFMYEPEQDDTDIESEDCPDGCDYQKDGCDIKGNISVSTGEYIYHEPGDEYYDATVINPDYGEKWFCTEDEAEASGWRRAEQ